VKKRDHVVCFDVDDTLALSGQLILISCPHWSETRDPHPAHIQAVKDHYERGDFVIIWSQRGYEWVESVVKAFGLENHVDLMIAKPYMHYDDLPSWEWIGERKFIHALQKKGPDPGSD
jgi:acid phosphatase class B